MFERRANGAVALALSLLLGAALWALLHRCLFEGQAQSHDAPLYVRSLWGIAHGDYNNSLLDYSSLAIHSQLGLLLLAPFARVWHAADVLITAQALAFAATHFVWLSALLRAARAAGVMGSLHAPWLSLLFSYGMPLVANPFVFDVRPEMLGVFFATAGLLRGAERQRWDGVSIALLTASAAAREEFALVAACGLMHAPVGRVALRTRAIWAGVCVAYFAANSYIFQWARGEAQTAHLASAAPWQDLALSKLQLLAAFVGAGGGLAMLGYRWLGSALPGLGMLALSTWMPSDQISFHYGMFVAPALLTASYTGYVAMLQKPRVWIAPHCAVALGCGLFLSALPGGARWKGEHFDLQGSPLSAAAWRAHSAWLAQVHQILQSVPREHSLLLQYMFAAPYADRPSIRVLEVPNANPWQPDAVLLPQKLWPTRGLQLREQGYRLSALAGSDFALLSRRTSTPLASVLSAHGCEGASLSWPDAGIQLCNAWREPDGRVTVLLGRQRSSDTRARLALGAGPHFTTTLLPLDGLIELADLPEGRVVWSTSRGALPSSQVTFTLHSADDRIIPLFVHGKQKEGITLTLLPPR